MVGRRMLVGGEVGSGLVGGGWLVEVRWKARCVGYGGNGRLEEQDRRGYLFVNFWAISGEGFLTLATADCVEMQM